MSTILLGFAAVNTGNNLLFLITGAMLGFMSVTGFIGLGNIRNLRLKVAVPDEIYAGIPTQLTLCLERPEGVFPAYLLDVTLGDRTMHVPVLPRQGSATGHQLISFPTRGRGELPQPHVSSPFPIGFFVRALPLPVEAEITVFPAPRQPAVPRRDAGRRQSGTEDHLRPGSGGDLFSISDYTGTETLRQIHWRLSARHDTLKVKQFGDTSSMPVVIDPDRLEGDRETRLGAAVFLVNRLHRLGRPVGLRLGGETIPPAAGRPHRLQLLKRLALHDLP